MFNTNTTEITKLDFEQLMRIELIKIITKVNSFQKIVQKATTIRRQVQVRLTLVQQHLQIRAKQRII